MPIPWNRDLQSIVSRDLGFDPDNPLVRMEVSQILRVHNWYARVAENRDNEPELPDPEEHTETAPTGGLFSRFFYITSGVIILVLAVGTLKLIRFARHS
jgi:hypothetical protein